MPISLRFRKRDRVTNNFVPRVSHLTAPGGGKMRDPGNEVTLDKVVNNAENLPAKVFEDDTFNKKKSGKKCIKLSTK